MTPFLYFPLLIMGFTFTITQVMVIRELLVVFTGNELSIAIILANWLLTEAAGGFFIGRKVEKWNWGAGSYASAQLLVALLLPLTLYAIRSLRDFMGLSLGEGANLLQMFFWTIPLLAPIGIVDGLLFALGCLLYSQWTRKREASIGRVYLYEALGAGIGGILYTFLFIPYLNSFQVAFLLGTVNLISGLILWGQVSKERRRKLVYLWIIFLLIFLWFLTPRGSRPWEELSQQRQWRGLKIIDSCWSPYGHLLVGQREEQLTFFANGIPIGNVPTPNIAILEELVHFPLLLLPQLDSILILGGGFGGMIYEALKHPLQEIHITEIDPLIIELVKKNLTPLSRAEITNPKVRIHIVDGRFFAKKTFQKFDAIILNLPPPYTLELNRFYTINFFQEVSRILKRDGLLVIPTPGSEAYLGPEIRDLNLNLWESLHRVFPEIAVIPGDPNYILASPHKELKSIKAQNMIANKRARKLTTKFLTDFHIQQKLDDRRQEWFRESLFHGKRVRLNKDETPTGLYYALAYWNAQFHPQIQPFWNLVGQLHFAHLLILGILLITVIYVKEKIKKGKVNKGCLIWVIITSGFWGTAMSILLIFSLQTMYGHVYHWIGLLIAAFMVGLALGSMIMTSSLKDFNLSTASLIKLEIFIIVFLICLLFLFYLFYSYGGWSSFLEAIKISFLIFSLIAGLAVGLEFPLTSKIFTELLKEVGQPAGLLYASDLIGACLGSLLVGVILIPTLGVLQTGAIILLLKFTSLFWLKISAVNSAL